MSKLTNYKQMYEELKNNNSKLQKEYSNLEKNFKDEKKKLILELNSYEKENEVQKKQIESLEKSLESKNNELNNCEDTVEKLKKELLNVGFNRQTIELKKYSEYAKINNSTFENGYESIMSACWAVKGQSDITDILKEKLQHNDEVYAKTQHFGDPSSGKPKEAYVYHIKTEEVPRLYPEISLE